MKSFFRFLHLFAVLMFFTALLPAVPLQAEDSADQTSQEITKTVSIDYYLAPDGSDTATGSAEAPFLTVTRARDQIRADKGAGKSGRWTIHIAPGEYPLTETISFGPEDSGTKENPIVYCGTSKTDRPVLTGGVELDGWQADGDIWFVELPMKDGRPLYFEQLFVNGRRAVRARWPNEGFLKVKEARDENPIDREKNLYPPMTAQSLTGEQGDLDFLKEIPAGELNFAQAIIHHHWDTSRRIILGFDAENDTLRFQGEPQKPHNPWRNDSLFYVENVRSAFDQPGEWFYDGAAHRVYYYPQTGETFQNTRFIVPRNGFVRFLTLTGTATQKKKTDADGKITAPFTGAVPVTDLVFENLTFSYSDTPRNPSLMKQAEIDESITGPLDAPGPSQFEPSQAAFYAGSVIDANHIRRIAFRDCEISHIGEYGISLTNARECRIERCELADLGAGGIRLHGIGGSGGDTPEEKTIAEEDGRAQYNVIDNNFIHHGGRFHASAVGIWLGNHTLDNEITHNDIFDFYYTGVSAGWTWGYQGGNALRNRIEFNKIHKIGQGALADMGGVYTLGTSHGTRVCNNVIFDVKSNSYGGWGLYTDEGSEGITMENNLVYDTTDGSFHQHYGRGNLIRNNILVNSVPVQVALTRVEPHLSLTFEKNLIVWAQGDAVGNNFDKAFARIHDNLWFCSTGPTLFRGKPHDQWSESEGGIDNGGIVADPLFVNPAKHDYRLKPKSPARKIGFQPFDFSRAGLYGEKRWTKKATE